jgi:hypothetical protein
MCNRDVETIAVLRKVVAQHAKSMWSVSVGTAIAEACSLELTGESTVCIGPQAVSSQKHGLRVGSLPTNQLNETHVPFCHGESRHVRHVTEWNPIFAGLGTTYKIGGKVGIGMSGLRAFNARVLLNGFETDPQNPMAIGAAEAEVGDLPMLLRVPRFCPCKILRTRALGTGEREKTNQSYET